MRKLFFALIVFLFAVTSFAATSAPPYSVRAVMVGTNGVLRTPTNFFMVNTNELGAAVATLPTVVVVTNGVLLTPTNFFMVNTNSLAEAVATLPASTFPVITTNAAYFAFTNGVTIQYGPIDGTNALYSYNPSTGSNTVIVFFP